MRQEQIKSKKHNTKRQLQASCIIGCLWGLIFVVGITLRLPYLLGLNLSPNPWQSLMTDTFPNGVRDIDFPDSYHGWVGGSRGLINTTKDGGNTWEEQHWTNVTYQDNVQVLAIDFINSKVGVAVVDGGGLSYILVTKNGGTNWNVLTHEKMSWLRDVVTVDEQTAWVLGEWRVNNQEREWVVFRVDITHLNWTVYSFGRTSIPNTTG